MRCFDLKGPPSFCTAGRSRSMPTATPVEAVDWDLMFRAVMARLRSTAGQPQDGLMPHACACAGIGAPTATVVLDCVRALEGLHAALLQARGPQPGG